jgi:hypothetical protein
MKYPAAMLWITEVDQESSSTLINYLVVEQVSQMIMDRVALVHSRRDHPKDDMQEVVNEDEMDVDS